jgi:RNA polymerase sigma-70 factor (ECF subfamily)
VRLALTFVSDHGAAEDVVQETWLGVVKGLKSFERRASLKTWIFRNSRESGTHAWGPRRTDAHLFRLGEPGRRPRTDPRGRHRGPIGHLIFGIILGGAYAWLHYATQHRTPLGA